MPNTLIDLAPSPGFCIKTATLQPAVYTPAPTQSPSPKNNILEQPQRPIPIPKGRKVFVNIAWDKNVPPPPEGSEEAIQNAMKGEDVDETNEQGWFVPVVVSEGREDVDKSGNPSLVFDCVYNSTVKSRTLRDPEFKIFLVELALQRIEAQTSLVLSRQIGTPNIAAKGKLAPRRVWVPTALLGGGSELKKAQQEKGKGRLIEEIGPVVAIGEGEGKEGGEKEHHEGEGGSGEKLKKLKGILKKGGNAFGIGHEGEYEEVGHQKLAKDEGVKDDEGATGMKPTWTWSKEADGALKFVIHVPGLTKSLITSTTLDIEPRRLILSVPKHAVLDINLSLTDAEIVANASREAEALNGRALGLSVGWAGDKDIEEESKEGKESERGREPNSTLLLKRQRDLEVEKARAEWRVGEGVLIVWC